MSMRPTRPALKAHDLLTGTSDNAVIRALSEAGPPFIFGTNDLVLIGDTFTIGDFVFKVVRWATKEEYINFLPDNRKYADCTKTFFEAVTD